MAKKVIRENQIEMFEPVSGYYAPVGTVFNAADHPPAIIPDRVHGVPILEPTTPTIKVVEPVTAPTEPPTAEPAKKQKGKINMDEATTGTTDNTILDNETHYCRVDLLKHLDKNLLVRRLSETLAAGIQLPKSTTFLMGLAIFSSVATRKYSVAYQYGGSVPIGLYVVAEQPPAAAKTRLQDEFQKPFDSVDKEKRELHQSEMKRLKDSVSSLQKQIDSADDRIKIAEFKSKLADVNAEIAELKANTIPLLFITNTTPEALEMSLHKTNGFFSLVSSEQTLFDSLFGLIGGDTGKQNNNEVVLNGFNAGKSGTLRIGRDAYSGRAAGGVALFAQNGSIEKVFNASNGTGLSERFLMLSEPHNLGRRSHENAPRINRMITDEYNSMARDIARMALNKDNESDDLSILTISEDAHLKINKFRDNIEPFLADGGKFATHQSLRGAAGKVDIQVMKIAANLHLLDGGAYQPEIKDEHVISAIFIVNDLLSAMLGLCHDKGLVGAKAEYSAIISYLSKKSKGATVNEIVNSLKSTKPFKDMTSGKNEAIRIAITEMVREQLLTADDGVYTVS